MGSAARGQAGLILIMIMAVLGAVTVGVASRAVEGLRTQEIENVSSQAFRAAEAGLEVALANKANVTTTSLGSGNANYSATYNATGDDGFVTDTVEVGDAADVSLVGAAGVTGLNIYWNTTAAVRVDVLSGDSTSGAYSVAYYSGDADATRRSSNKFSAATSGSFSFKSVSFNNKLTIPINLAASPPPQLVRVLVFYEKTAVGIEPVGGTLASGQVVTVKSTGTVDNNIVSNLSFTKYSDRVPAVFENVLYTNTSLNQ